MKLREYSDLHLDRYANRYSPGIAVREHKPIEDYFWFPPSLPDDRNTVLILAGDLWIGDRFVIWSGWSWIKELSHRFEHIFIVLGNHDYWSGIMLDLPRKIRAGLEELGITNVTILDKSSPSQEYKGVLFVGDTLWTSMDKGRPLVMLRMRETMSYDGKCRLTEGKSFSSKDWLRWHIEAKQKIFRAVADFPDLPSVVITHHAPSFQSIDPKWTYSSANPYYASSLEEDILDHPNIKFWFHGHCHDNSDYLIGETRVICNPVGYIREGRLDQGLVKHEVIEIEPAKPADSAITA